MTPQLPNPNQSDLAANPANAPAGPDQIDQILLDDTLVPTSGFAASIMEAVAREEARQFAPAPIPFPWKRALPTLAAILIAIVGMVRFASQLHATLASHPNLDQIDLAQFSSNPIATQALPAILAIAGTLAGLLLTRYLALGRLRG